MKELLASTLLAESLVLAFLLAVHLGHAVLLGARERRDGPRLEAARSAVAAALQGETGDTAAAVAALRRLRVRQRMELLMDLARVLRGAGVQQLAGDVGVLEQARRWCLDRRWWRRLHGARVFTALGGGEGFLPALMLDRHPQVRAQSALWAADHPTPDRLRRLIQMMEDAQPIVAFSAKDALVRAGKVSIFPIGRHLANPKARAVVDALEVARALADPQFLDVALERARDARGPVRATAADLLAGIGGEAAIDCLVELLTDPAADVRARAAAGIGKLRHWPAAGAVGDLLEDPTWEARRAAGATLLQLGAPGTLYLRRALQEGSVGADVARQALEGSRHEPRTVAASAPADPQVGGGPG